MSSCPLETFNPSLIASPSPRSKRLVGVSLKLYFTLTSTSTYITSILPLATHASTQPLPVDLFIIPDLLSLPSSQKLLEGSNIALGAPDCFWEDEGAFTGAVSPRSLREMGVSIVMLGHAERRRLFGETDESVALKARAVMRHNMVPLICIGEQNRGTVQEAAEEVQPQVESILKVLRDSESGGGEKEVVFAYEPVWAIGASEPASAEHVRGVVGAMRCIVRAEGRGNEVRFLYGGSAGPGTYGGLRKECDGLFLGRFAHDVGRFWEVVGEVGARE